jgi:hypothetical protein
MTRIFISNCNKLFLGLLLLSVQAVGQTDSSFLKKVAADTSQGNMNVDAVKTRPFLQLGKLPVALGGYLEVNTNYSGTDGANEGFSFQFRRLTLFLSSTITERIKFLSELEFEDGTKEINIEFAAVDLEFSPLLNLRGGIVMNPIGAFNQNHDGPKWEFVERPFASTQLLPATFSNTGMGVHGKMYRSKWVFAYETYLTNGLNDAVIINTEGKTFLPSVKNDPERFEENFTGSPLFTGKLAVKRRNAGEIGLSYMSGIYNKYMMDGIVIDTKRKLNVLALDMNFTLAKVNTVFNGEAAFISVQLPEGYTEQYGNEQFGAYLDIVQPFLKRTILGWERAVLNFAFRTEYVDWNRGSFVATEGKVYDDLFAITPGISFRPSAQIVLRLNYRYQWQRDLLGNPPGRTAAIQFGWSAYF